MPIEAIGAAMSGPDWSIAMPEATGFDGVGGAGGAEGVEGAGGDKGFGGMLADQVQNLQGLQDEAAKQSTALAMGTASDASEVVMAVERARLSMQLAASMRDKSVEAFQEIFRTQV